jgi:hypothetical protein
MLKKFLNSVKLWGKILHVQCKRVQCSVMGEIEQIKILSLKSLIIASLPLKYKEVL